jgi:exodeoxyribonuclease VII large subunit
MADPVAARLVSVERALSRAPGLGRGLARRHERIQVRARHLEERLRAASPYSILERGYAVVTDAQGRVVQRAGALATGDDLSIRFARGSAGARVTSIEDEEDG